MLAKPTTGLGGSLWAIFPSPDVTGFYCASRTAPIWGRSRGYGSAVPRFRSHRAAAAAALITPARGKRDNRRSSMMADD